MSIELTEDQMREVTEEVADRFCCSHLCDTDRAKFGAARDTLADQIETLAGANTILSMLFKGATVEQAMERCKGNSYLIQSFRTLGRLTAQCAKSLDEATNDKAHELADDEAEIAAYDEAEARAA